MARTTTRKFVECATKVCGHERRAPQARSPFGSYVRMGRLVAAGLAPVQLQSMQGTTMVSKGYRVALPDCSFPSLIAKLRVTTINKGCAL